MPSNPCVQRCNKHLTVKYLQGRCSPCTISFIQSVFFDKYLLVEKIVEEIPDIRYSWTMKKNITTTKDFRNNPYREKGFPDSPDISGYMDDDDSKSNDTSRRVTNALEVLSDEETKDFNDFRRSLGVVGGFTKQMVKLAIDQLKPEFERMAERAADRVMDFRGNQSRDLQDVLNRKEQELRKVRLEKKILQAKLDKELSSKDHGGGGAERERDMKRLEVEINSLRSKLRRKTDELKKERDRACSEEEKRIEVENTLQSEIDKLKKDLDKVKGHLGQLRSAKNVGDEETKKLRERERQLLEEIEDLRLQPSIRRKTTR